MFKLPQVKQPLHKLFGIISSSPVRRRLIKGLGANTFSQVVNVIIQLASVPIFLHFWGAELYGKWLIISSIPGYLSMSDIGFGSVAGNEMTMLTARQDYKEASSVFQSAWVFVTSVCSVIGILVVALAYLLPFNSWFNLQPLPRTQVSLAISLLALQVLVAQQGGLLDAAFRSDGRYAQGTALASFIRLMEWTLALISVSLGGQLIATALIFLVGRVVGYCWMWLMFKRANQWLSIGCDKARLETIRRLIKPAISFMAFPMSNALIFQGMTLTVGALLNPVAVVIFTTSRTVTRIISQFINLINFAVWPEFSSAFGSGNLPLARKLHQKASFFSFWLSIVASILLIFIGPWLLRIWTGNQIVINLSLFYLMLLLVVSSSFWQSSSVVLMATNRHSSFAKISFISSFGGIAIAYVLLKLIGLDAAPISLLLTDIIIGFYATRTALIVMKETFSDYIIALLDWRSALS
jgi:O-antigen/teichoic acid export membrane protein